MACEKPVIASDLPWLREFLTEETSVFFRPEDAEDLAEKIRYVLEHPEKAAEMGRKGRKVVVDNYTWKRAAEKLVEVYGIAIERHR